MQSTATAPVKTARETIFGEREIGSLQEDINLNAPRFFVQMGWATLGVDTLAVPNLRFLRGEITPCRTYPQKDNKLAIREGDLIPGMDEEDKDGKTVYGYYRRYAFHEAERLVELERRNERQTGMVEIEALRTELGREVYRAVNFNTLFFPDWPNLPEKNEDVIKALRDRIAVLAVAPPPPHILPHYVPVVLAVGEELIAATEKAQAVQKHQITYTHQCMKLAPKEDQYKRAYDSVDYEMLKRTGLPEIHAAEVQTAQALEKLTDGRSNADNGLNELVKVQQEQLALMREQMERQNQLIDRLLAERDPRPTARTPKKQNADTSSQHRTDPAETEGAESAIAE